jgi:hypothetical protein
MRQNPAAAAVVLHAPSPLAAAFRLKPASPPVPDPARRHQSRSAEASTATHDPHPVDTTYNRPMPLIAAFCMKSAPPPAPDRAYRSSPPISVCQRLRPTPGRHLLPAFPGRCRSPSPMPGRLPRPASNLAPWVNGNSLRFGSCLILRCELPWSVFAIGWR